MVASSDKVIIIGGGIGGLTAALALLRRGIDVEVYEQAPELKEVGAGIQISSNGTRVLYALGLEDALKRVQVLPSGREIRHWSTGETWNWFDSAPPRSQRYGTPHVMLHRGDLHGLLAERCAALKPDAIGSAGAASRSARRASQAEVAVRGRRNRARRLRDRRRRHPLQGARRACSAPTRREFTGVVAWRGFVPMERLPPHICARCGTNWLGPRGHVLHYPVRRGELMNFISFVERDDWQIESWTIAGHHRRARQRLPRLASRTFTPSSAAIDDAVTNGR